MVHNSYCSLTKEIFNVIIGKDVVDEVQPLCHFHFSHCVIHFVVQCIFCFGTRSFSYDSFGKFLHIWWLNVNEFALVAESLVDLSSILKLVTFNHTNLVVVDDLVYVSVEDSLEDHSSYEMCISVMASVMKTTDGIE